ncbi:MAG TPA: RagB/SusD family nutrient uptake outer membrane protein [Prolixibacteraceae bacterium]|nr:RagB/SusD family nutrient uptake outer membrane protein [Prolixibacteraceae bacterium]
MTWIYNFINKRRKSPVFYSILLISMISLISSCTKDVLDKSPTDRFSDEAVWKDGNLIEQFVNNTYRVMPTCFSGGNYTSIAIIFAELTDELYGRGGNHNYINQGNITAAQLGALDWWTVGRGYNYWTVITQCNIFFSNIDAAPVDASIKNRMIGEMQFFRAYAYFRLVALYGGVPLITKPFGLTDDFKVPRNTYDECMNFVITELDAAAALLPTTYPAANLGRITKGAVLSIKSRALLYMASPLNNPANTATKWQAAADAAKVVIDLNLYSLYPNYKEQFMRTNSYNSEAIWSRPYNYSVSAENISFELRLYPNGYSGYGQVHPYQNIVDEFEMVSGKLPKDDPAYDPQNPYVNRDPRFYATILYDGAPFKGRPVETFIPGGMDSREGPISSWNATETGYYVRKFIDESITNPSSLNQANNPWIFSRYAEILLNYAEAKYNLGDEATCRQYINMIRSRPGVNMPPVTEAGVALLTRLQHERQIELIFEEHRWFDVRRWKIAPVVLNTLPKRMDIVKNLTTGVKTYTINTMQQFTFVFTDKNYLVPIPQTEIDKNPLLKQNPGY